MLNDPGNLDVVMAYAQVATKTGDYEGAVGAYEACCSSTPTCRG